MILCELGQAWKGAAAADDSCAGMWLGARHPIYPRILLTQLYFRTTQQSLALFCFLAYRCFICVV